jgi:Homeodomain-like domain
MPKTQMVTGLDRKHKDMKGKRYGKLTVQQFMGVNELGRSIWLCSCSCGGTRETVLWSTLKACKKCMRKSWQRTIHKKGKHVNKILKLHQAGKTVTDISKKVNLSRQRVSQILQRWNASNE